MRWIFFVLVGANALLLGWQLLKPVQKAPEPQSSPESPRHLADSAETLVLLRERPSAPAARPQPDELPSVADLGTPKANSLGRSEEAPLESRLCTYVGPYKQREEAAALVQRLEAMEVAAQVQEVEVPTGPGYWVHLEPYDSRREALRRLNELHARGVDSFIIPRGELAHGISLGMFSKESLAQARKSALAEMGIEAKVRVVERTHHELWVAIPADQARQLGDQAWERLLEDAKSADRRQNFCLHVASQDNIH